MTTEIKEYIIWSGGCDSTYILHRLGKDSSENNPIYTLSVSYKKLNVKKNELERKARKNILENFKKRGFHIVHKEIEIKGTIEPTSNQPLNWLGAISSFIPDYSNVHFGYVFDDSFWHKRPQFTKAFYSLMDIKCNMGDNDITLFYDLEWIHKEEIVEDAINNKYLKLIFTCEDPIKNKACKKCNKCLELKEVIEKV